MVNHVLLACVLVSASFAHAPLATGHSLLAAAQDSAPEAARPKRGIEKLDNKSRAKALAALAALVILGLGMLALTWLGARVTRRYMNPTPYDHERIKSSAPPADDWAKKPLIDNSQFQGTGPADSPLE